MQTCYAYIWWWCKSVVVITEHMYVEFSMSCDLNKSQCKKKMPWRLQWCYWYIKNYEIIWILYSRLCSWLSSVLYVSVPTLSYITSADVLCSLSRDIQVTSEMLKHCQKTTKMHFSVWLRDCVCACVWVIAECIHLRVKY